MCLFTVRVYLKACVTAPLATSAPYNDMHLLNTLLNCSTVNASISKIASSKLANHLWYLSEELVSLGFFDSQVSLLTKRLMVKAMQEVEGVKQPQKRVIVVLDTYKERKFEDLYYGNR